MGEQGPGADLEMIEVEQATTDPEALREAQRRIGEVARLAEVVDASIDEGSTTGEDRGWGLTEDYWFIYSLPGRAAVPQGRIGAGG